MPASRGTPDGAGLWPAFPVVAQERRCLRDEAVLEMQDSLSGMLHLHGGTCRVEGVFEAISY